MAPLAKYRGRRYGGAKKSAPKRAAQRRAGVRKASAMRARRSPGGYRKLIQSAAGLMTNSLWSYKSRPLPFRIRALKAVGAPDVFHQNYAQVLNTVSGLQAYTSFPTCTPAQLKSISESTPSGQPNRVCIESAQTEITFTNVNNTSCEVELYDIFFKRDLSVGANITSGGNNYAFDNIDEMIKVGCQAGSSIAPGGTDVSRYIGASPFDSQPFKNFCRVVKRTHVMLASGASHRHQALIGINKLGEESVIGNDDLTYIKGFTYATLLYVRGVGAYDPADVTGGATTNGVFLNVVTSTRIKYTFVTDNTNSITYNNMPLPLGIPNVRNPVSGAYEALSP